MIKCAKIGLKIILEQSKFMNNERYNHIIDEAYENYKRITHNKNEKNGNWGIYSRWEDTPLIAGVQHLTKSSFIQMCKVNPEFSKNWGVTIYTEVEDDEVWMGIVYNGNAAKIKIK